MKVIYDRDSDTLSIILRKGRVAESEESSPGMILDFDESGCLLSLEVLDAFEPRPTESLFEYTVV